MKSSPPWAPAAWARSIGRAIQSSVATSRSRFFLPLSRRIQKAIGSKDDKLVFIFNFFDELKRLAPSSPQR
jgi:hypothetical protein